VVKIPMTKPGIKAFAHLENEVSRPT